MKIFRRKQKDDLSDSSICIDEPDYKRGIKVLMNLISMLIIGWCAVYGILKFISWTDTLHPLLGNLLSAIVVVSFFHCCYIGFRFLEDTYYK